MHLLKYRAVPSSLLLVLAIGIVAALVGCGDSASTASSEPTDRFSADRAWQFAKLQVEAGQRPAGSSQLRKLATELRPLLPNGSFESIPGEPRLRNIVGTLPGRQPAIVVGAHYDTLAKPSGFVGANNGAAGTAVVIEAARALQNKPTDSKTPREVRFVLFDGEEPPAVQPSETANFYQEGLRGSRAYTAAHPKQTSAMILLDYVGNRGLHLPRESNSTPSLWNRLLRAARAVGAERSFSKESVAGIVDDHAPFLRERVPAIDLIDWSYSGHNLSDRLDQLSPQSLAAVGDTIVELVSRMRE